MSAPIAKFHFSRRGRQGLRLLAYGGAACAYLYALHVSGPTFALCGSLFIAPAVLHYVRSQRERHGDERPDWVMRPVRSAAERREFARLPFANPFDPETVDLTLEERITEAAEASMQFGRRVSVVHIFAPGAGRAAVEEAAAVIRTRLRGSDHVEVAGDEEIVVCVNMIRDRQNADLVLARVRDAVAGQGIDCAGWLFGRAICPMHGYTGEDLIESARCDSGAAKQRRRVEIEPRLRLARGGLAVVSSED